MSRSVVPLRTDRDGRLSLAQPLTRGESISRVVTDLCIGLAIIGAILVIVGLVAGDGFGVSVPVQGVEEDDGPRSEEP